MVKGRTEVNEKKTSGSLLSWYCPNCGNLLRGFQSTDGTIRVKCDKCLAVSVRKIMSRRHNRFDVFPKEGEETIAG